MHGKSKIGAWLQYSNNQFKNFKYASVLVKYGVCASIATTDQNYKEKN